MRWLSAIALTVLFCAGAIVLLQEPRGAKVRLPEGTDLELLGITFGTQHALVRGPLWATLFRDHLPEAIASGAGLTTYREKTDADKPVLWTRLRGRVPDRWQEWSGTKLVAIDEHGCEITNWPVVSTPDFNRRINAWKVRSFPRRGETLRVQMYRGGFDDQWELLAEFSNQNPTSRSYPQWAAKPLPLSMRDGDFSVELVGFETGKPRSTLGENLSPDSPMRSRLTFRVRQGTRTSLAWVPRLCRISDATGNELTPTSVRAQVDRSQREVSLDFDIPLSSDEHAWKLDLEFFRNTEADNEPFSSGELWQFRNAIVPREGTSTTDWMSAGKQKLRLKLAGVARTHRRKTFEPKHKRSAPPLQIQMEGERETQLRLLRATDDRGRVLCSRPLYPSAWSYDANTTPPHTAYFELAMPKSSRSLDLAFAVCPNHQFTVIATPTRADM